MAVNIKKMSHKFLLGAAATTIVFTGMASSVSANEVQSPNITQGEQQNKVIPYNVINLDKVATIKSLDSKLWTNPQGLEGSKAVPDLDKYKGKDYHVTKQEDVEGITWYQLKQGKKEIGWVKKDSISIKDFLEKENAEEYDNVGKVKDDAKKYKVWTEPRYTEKSSFVADISEYENKPLQIVEKAETKEDDKTKTWYKFKHNGDDVGWVNAKAIEVGKHDIAYIFRSGDTLDLIEDTFDKTQKDLQKINPNLNLDKLQDGDKIKLFIGEPLKEGKSAGLHATGKDGSYVKATPAASTQDFIKQIVPAVEEIKDQGVLPSVTIAQAIIESRSGNSGLAIQGNNLFGIKGTYNGNGVTFQTQEFYGGQYVTVHSTFRSYPSWNESIVDHARFLNQNPRYQAIIGEEDYRNFTAGLQKAGYATSPTYAQTLNNVIETYGLYNLDK